MALQPNDQTLLVRMSAIFIGIATLLLIVIGISYIKSYGFIGASAIESAKISVSGHGEAFAIPDTATFSFAVEDEASTVPAAQSAVTEKANKVIAYLKSAGIDEKDIKTTSYDIYPRYEYPNPTPYGGQGTRVLAGYDVSENVSVKVRKTDQAGTILSKVGGFGVSNISGLEFTVDNEDAVKSEARGKAIADAKAKADALAKELGVHLVQVIDFNESGDTTPRPIYGVAGMKAEDSMSAPAPELPAGQNKFTSNVTITYKIR